tara:strand:+ start:992 stop:1945 length:954 start_codon:yes stop_codon:yes gene_type:complete
MSGSGLEEEILRMASPCTERPLQTTPPPLLPPRYPSPPPYPPPELHLDAVVGTGKYGVVYRGRMGQRQVAIKCIPNDEDCALSIERELKALQRCSNRPHENIAALFCKQLLAGQTLIVTELGTCELFTLVASEDGIEKERLRSLGRRMSAAVCHLHSINIAHRDIKLENWVLHPTREILLIDFGLSHVFERDRSFLQEYVGTFPYCSPEILEQKSHDPFAGDMWSMGVCYFAMSASFFPYKCADTSDSCFLCVGSAFQETLVNEIYKFYSRDCGVDKEFAQTISALLAVTPARRPTSAELCKCSWLQRRPVCGSLNW